MASAGLNPPSASFIVISGIRARGVLDSARYFICVSLGTQEYATAKVKPYKSKAVEWANSIRFTIENNPDGPNPLRFQLYSVAKESIFRHSGNAIGVIMGDSSVDWKELGTQGEPRELLLGDVIISFNMKVIEIDKLVENDLRDASRSVQGINQLPGSLSQCVEARGVVVEGIQTALDVAGPLLEKFEKFVTFMDKVAEIHPYVNAAWVVLSAIPKIYVQELVRNKKILVLLDSLEETYECIIKDEDMQRIGSPNIQHLITLLANHTRECAYFIQSYASMSHRSRMMAAVFTNLENRIEELISNLGELRAKLTALLTQAATVGAIQVPIAIEGIAFVGKELEDLAQTINLNDIPYAGGVSYNKKKACLPNTRVSLLQQIRDWVDCFDEDEQQKVLLLTGVAGSGKSSVAHSISDHYSQLGRLGSSFFFNIRSEDPPGGDKVFSTIARDIADTFPLFKFSLAKTANTRRIRQTKQPSEQFQSFIVKAIGTLADSQVMSVGPVLIVIDALDECPAETRDEFVQTLVDDLADLPPNFRVLITSRPEEVQNLLEMANVRHLDLGAIGPKETEADIRLFVRNRLSKVARRLDDPRQRPHHKDWVEQLVRRSEMLFIWADTACKQIASPISRSPSQVLDNILTRGGSGIDDLYLFALRHAMGEDDDDQALSDFKALMTRLVILKLQVSVNELNFMQSQVEVDDNFPSDVSFLVFRLGAVLGGATNFNEPIQFLHSSFRDFILDEKRSGRFCINDPGNFAEAHFALAKTCAAVMEVFSSKENLELAAKTNSRPLGYSVYYLMHLFRSGRTVDALERNPIISLGTEVWNDWYDEFVNTPGALSPKDQFVVVEGIFILSKILNDTDWLLSMFNGAQPPTGYSWTVSRNEQNTQKLRSRSVLITVDKAIPDGPNWSTSLCSVSPLTCSDWVAARVAFLTEQNTILVWSPSDAEYKGVPIHLGDEVILQIILSFNGNAVALLTAQNDLVLFCVDSGDLRCRIGSPVGFPELVLYEPKHGFVQLRFPGSMEFQVYDILSSILHPSVECLTRLPLGILEEEIAGLEMGLHVDDSDLIFDGM